MSKKENTANTVNPKTTTETRESEGKENHTHQNLVSKRMQKIQERTTVGFARSPECLVLTSVRLLQGGGMAFSSNWIPVQPAAGVFRAVC